MGSQKLYKIFNYAGVSAPNLHIVQGQLYKPNGILQVEKKVTTYFKTYYIYVT